jgi:hypothetical protein
MFLLTQSTQSWYRHTMRLHVLHVSGYCGDPSFCLLHLPTLGVRCTGMLFMYCPYIIKCIKYFLKKY